jgi:hypothetical protein
MSEFDFDANLPVIINEIVVLAQRMAGARRTWTSVSELADRLRRPSSEVIRAFDLLGLTPMAWSDPNSYSLEAIIESGSRHEVAARYNRAS